MTIYLDASIVVALFAIDVFSERAEHYLRTVQPTLVVSDFAAAEFASAMARRVRTRDLTTDEARVAFSNFDSWTNRMTTKIETTGADVATSASFLRRLDLTLRTADALHIAIAQRIGATLLTFDTRMADAARALGTEIAAA